MISPEAEDLVDGLVGVLAVAQRARVIVEDAAAAPTADESCSAADADLVLVMLGVATMARRLEEALARWEPAISRSEWTATGAVSSMRDLLR